MPDIARESKIANVRRYGGRPYLVAEAERALAVARIVAAEGSVEVHPYAAAQVIAGQATLGLEILDGLPDLDLVVAPIGGGGLSTGLSLAFSRRSGIDLLVVEPELAGDAWALAHGRQPDLSRAHESAADGLRSLVAPHNLARLREYGAEFATVSEDQIVGAWQTLVRLGYAVEPSAAVGLAGLLARPRAFRGRAIAVVLTGGNTDRSPSVNS
jgi:threonine dehydratase